MDILAYLIMALTGISVLCVPAIVLFLIVSVVIVLILRGQEQDRRERNKKSWEKALNDPNSPIWNMPDPNDPAWNEVLAEKRKKEREAKQGKK